MDHYVYLLRCKDGIIYTGCTQNLEKRLIRHQKGLVKTTSTRLPVELILSIGFPEKHLAYRFEKYLKSGSGVAFRNKRLLK